METTSRNLRNYPQPQYGRQYDAPPHRLGSDSDHYSRQFDDPRSTGYQRDDRNNTGYYGQQFADPRPTRHQQDDLRPALGISQGKPK